MKVTEQITPTPDYVIVVEFRVARYATMGGGYTTYGDEKMWRWSIHTVDPSSNAPWPCGANEVASCDVNHDSYFTRQGALWVAKRWIRKQKRQRTRTYNVTVEA
jgi:hypothetical protein